MEVASVDQCQMFCINATGCVAVDWQPGNPQDKNCWLLTSTSFQPTTKPGHIDHYELDASCLSAYAIHCVVCYVCKPHKLQQMRTGATDDPVA